jgi:hypothetical protein
MNDDFNCEDRTAPRADHVLIETCDHGTVFIRLIGKDGKCFAIAPFDPATALSVVDAIAEKVLEAHNRTHRPTPNVGHW